MSDDQLRSAFTEVTGGYYRSPDPRQAALAFRCLLELLVEAGPENLARFGSRFGGAKRRAKADALCALGLDVDLETRTIRSEGIVAACCRAEAERPGGPARRLLRTIPVADRAPFAL
jgi:hypothetical protein